MFVKFVKDASGTIAVMFALSLVVLLVAVGAAVDFGYQLLIRQNIQIAIDHASMTGLLTARDALNSGSPEPQARRKAEAAAQAMFTANGQKTSKAQAVFSFDKSGAILRVDGKATATVPSFLMQLAGVRATEIQASSTASVETQQFRNVYIVADVSGSMLLPATKDGLTRMNNATGCAFACHSGGDDPYSFAENNKIVLRYDVVQQGVGQLMDYLSSNPSYASLTRAGLWAFADSLKNPAPLTANFAQVKASYPPPSLFYLPNGAWNPDTFTNFQQYADQFIDAVGRGGDGSSANNPQKLVIMATDGLHDDMATRLIVPMSMSFCDTLKAKNVTVAIINTPYLPMPWDLTYVNTLGMPGREGGATRGDDIPIMMKKCAGNLLIIANDSATLKNAFQKIFETVAEPRLTQ